MHLNYIRIKKNIYMAEKNNKYLFKISSNCYIVSMIPFENFACYIFANTTNQNNVFRNYTTNNNVFSTVIYPKQS